MNWSAKQVLIAGLALIALANVAALGSVAYNRSGTAESELLLSQRELAVPYQWRSSAENSGLSLTLQWRVYAGDTEKTDDAGVSFSNYNRQPSWLDKAKLAELGFDITLKDASDSEHVYRRQQEREVLLVLELNGTAYQQTLARTRLFAAQETALAANNPGKEFERRAKNASERLQQEENLSSRLFIIDAGLNLDSLRTQYPDRSRFLILRGMVQPSLQYKRKGDKERQLAGYINRVNIDSIHVPMEFRAGLEQTLQNSPGKKSQKAFAAVVAFGQRLEPWLKKVSVTAAAEAAKEAPSP